MENQSHKLVLPTQVKIPWPSYKGVSQLVGTTLDGRCTVYVDPSLGAQGMAAANSLLAGAPVIMSQNDSFFGTPGGAVNVILFALGGATDGTGGADHMACDFTTGNNIEVDVSFGSPARMEGLFEAELSECSMGGNVCGQNTGEALSRWCAMTVSNNALADFATAPTWFRQGAENWIDKTDNTDQNPDSTGCGMAFISWLSSQGYGITKIAPEMTKLGNPGTFAELYAALTDDQASNAWPKFIAAIQALPHGVTTDNPFATTTPPPPPPPPSNIDKTELRKLVHEAIYSDYGNPAITVEQMAADIEKPCQQVLTDKE